MKEERFYGGNIKFIKTDNLRDNEIKFPFTNYLSELGNSEIKRTELQEDDIITTIIGATYDVIARSCIIRKELLPANINQNIAQIRPDKSKIVPEYLNVYLNSKYGKMYLEYLSRQMEQVNLNCDEVGRLKVPLFSHCFQVEIENVVKSAHAKLEDSKQLYTDAENILLEELGLKNWQPKNENINVKTLSESFLSSGRLDAEYYQSKYDEIENYLKQNNKTDLLGNICFVNQKNTKPNDKEQYKYIELSNINSIGEITGCTIDYGENLPTRARQVVKSGDVIVSSVEGSLDSCALVTSEYDNAFCSTGFYIIRSKTITSETLLVLMKLKPIQQLLKKGCSGTILTAINYDNFCNIVIPIPDGNTQTEIFAKIQRSFALKKESKSLLEQAKTMVENEIEKGDK